MPAARRQLHEQPEPPAPAGADAPAEDRGVVSLPSDVLLLQRTIGNHATGAILGARMLQRLGSRLDKPLRRGAPRPLKEIRRQRLVIRLRSTSRCGSASERAQALAGGPQDDRARMHRAHRRQPEPWRQPAAGPRVQHVRAGAQDDGRQEPDDGRHQRNPVRRGARWIMFAKLFWSNRNPDPNKRKKPNSRASAPRSPRAREHAGLRVPGAAELRELRLRVVGQFEPVVLARQPRQPPRLGPDGWSTKARGRSSPRRSRSPGRRATGIATSTVSSTASRSPRTTTLDWLPPRRRSRDRELRPQRAS